MYLLHFVHCSKLMTNFYFTVVVNILLISLILLSSATLIPWLYPFLYYIQVSLVHKYVERFLGDPKPLVCSTGATIAS